MVARQAPWSMRFPRQEHWSELSSPSPEDLPDPGAEPRSPALAGRLFTTEPPGATAARAREGPGELLHMQGQEGRP